MEPEAAVYFRDQLRQARAAALQDAEGFQEILFVLERLGSYLTHEVEDLTAYRGKIIQEARNSHLAYEIPKQHFTWHSKFSKVYDLVRDARNDALHQGAFARHLTDNAIQLALVMEDALMSTASTVGEFMVREPVCAYPWQPISFIRQQMLKNSFTYLPFLPESKEAHRWPLVSDFHIAEYLRRGDRKERLATRLQDVREEEFSFEYVETCFTDTSINDVLKMSQGKPVLVVDKEHREQLIGIITPFDLL